MQHMYLQRLSEPHLQISETHQLYSTFVSTYLNRAYEESMVAAQAALNATMSQVALREPKEERLRRSNYSLEAYSYYLGWELEVKVPDLNLTRALYERALTRHTSAASLWCGYLDFMVRCL